MTVPRQHQLLIAELLEPFQRWVLLSLSLRSLLSQLGIRSHSLSASVCVGIAQLHLSDDDVIVLVGIEALEGSLRVTPSVVAQATAMISRVSASFAVALALDTRASALHEWLQPKHL